MTSDEIQKHEFNLKVAIDVANEAVFTKLQRNLSDIEILILKGSWEREEYDQIAAKHQYSTNYIRQDVAPKLWNTLTEALGEKVKKSNFKEALKRCWLQENNPPNKPYISLDDQAKNLIYIERSPLETICYETLLHPGSLVRLKAPKFMGKTFLVNRVLTQLAKENYQTISLSLELADREAHFVNLNKFLRWFCLNLSYKLKLPSLLDVYWDEEGMGAKVSCTTYFEDYLLEQSNQPIILCLDDIDILFPYPKIYEDFFGLLRSWYEKAKLRKLWQKLRLILVHSTDIYISLNINQSPFNVGVPLELSEFSREQVQEFARQHGVQDQVDFINSLIHLVGGHPYLLEIAFTYLKNYPEITPEKFLIEAITETGIYRNHLQDLWIKLHQNPQLTETFQKIITTENPIQLDPIASHQLQSLGLIKLSGNQIQARCRLYSQYFSKYFNLQ